MKKTIELTSLQLRKLIEAVGCYRHDNKEDIDNLDEIVLRTAEDKLVKKYREIRPDFVPWY